MCSGTALVDSAGHIIIGLNTVWAWGTGAYVDPTSAVYIDFTAGTHDVTYFGTAGARNFKATIQVVPCGALLENVELCGYSLRKAPS